MQNSGKAREQQDSPIDAYNQVVSDANQQHAFLATHARQALARLAALDPPAEQIVLPEHLDSQTSPTK